jgi:pyridinium-3,5-bisthiocarboxylic acid mononucleotide nickel chelatase
MAILAEGENQSFVVRKPSRQSFVTTLAATAQEKPFRIENRPLPRDRERPTTYDVRRKTKDESMRLAYLDCFSGISGDMFLAALIDAGVSPAIFEHTVAALNVGAKLEISRVDRSGISAHKVDVLVNGEKDSPRDAHAHKPHNHHHEHDHHHDSLHHEHSHSRTLSEIRNIIRKAEISEHAKKLAIAIFEKLGAAEAKIHNIPVEEIHFHEVGAVDALVDIVCAAMGAEALGVDEFVCSPLNVGGGTVTCAHGTFPVPAPATVELLKGVPVYSSGLQAELVTPTGAAIVATLVKRFEPFPSMKIEKSGYGAGTHDFPGHANVLRMIVGESVVEHFAGEGARATHASREVITVLEANLDDMNPQVFGYLMERLLEAGALDVFSTAVQMKKNRLGTLLTVLAEPEDADALSRIIFAETTTLGVRRREEDREVLARKIVPIGTRFGEIRMKLASLNGSVSHYAPEYEDCRRIAAEQRVPLKLVMQEAVQEFLKKQEK